MVFAGASENDIKEYCIKVAESIRNGTIDPAMLYQYTSLKRSFEDYINLAGGNVGAKWFNDVMASDTVDPIGVGHGFFFTHAVDGPTILTKGGWIAFTDAAQIEGFTLDWKLIAEKAIEKPIGSLFESVGWNKELLKEKKTYVLSDFAA